MPFYNSASCDITLICGDGVKFTVHKHVLRTFSEVFDDMFISKAISDDGKVELPEPSNIVKEFLDLAYDHVGDFDANTILGLVAFCDKYGAPRIRKMIITVLEKALEDPPTHASEIFGIASQLNDPSLAAKAITCFGAKGSIKPAANAGPIHAHKSIHDWVPSDITGITSEYHAMYFTAYDKARSYGYSDYCDGYHHKRTPNPPVNLGDIAMSFEESFKVAQEASKASQ